MQLGKAITKVNSTQSRQHRRHGWMTRSQRYEVEGRARAPHLECGVGAAQLSCEVLTHPLKVIGYFRVVESPNLWNMMESCVLVAGQQIQVTIPNLTWGSQLHQQLGRRCS